jgi:hypothetical protein
MKGGNPIFGFFYKAIIIERYKRVDSKREILESEGESWIID